MKTSVSKEYPAGEQVTPSDYLSVQPWTSIILMLYGAANFLGGREFLLDESSQPLC